MSEFDVFERIKTWNKERDNTNFSHFNETKMLAEELFEFCGFDREDAKINGRDFAEDFSVFEIENENGDFPFNYDGPAILKREEAADAAGDMIYIAIGTIYKLGFDPKEVMQRICDANDKKGNKKDADGKIIKDENFVEPVLSEN